jgi:GT2 family glycosyltransferase
MTDVAAYPRTTLFFITYNQRDIAVATLRDALAQDYPAAQLDIVALDDGSDDDTAAALCAAASGARNRFELIVATRQADYRSASLWNRCIAAAVCDTSIFIQVDDVRLRPDFVAQHVKWHRDGVDRLVTGAKFEGPAETWALSACRRHGLARAGGTARHNVPPTAIWGASLSYPRKILPAACANPAERPYDETMTGYGHHEVEFAIRLNKAGAELVYDPAAGVFHRDHEPVAERRRGFDRQQLVERGLAENARFICTKHALDALPRW